jgi:hypothetical protein
MKKEIDIKSQIEMSELINQTSEDILKNIELGDVDGFRQCLQLFIIQYDLYKDMLSGNGLAD